jgi:cysteine synthase
LYDPNFADQTIGISTEAAQAMARRMTCEEGLHIGVSAGAAICAALKLAATIDRGVIVAICPDGGERYQSEKFWETK